MYVYLVIRVKKEIRKGLRSLGEGNGLYKESVVDQGSNHADVIAYIRERALKIPLSIELSIFENCILSDQLENTRRECALLHTCLMLTKALGVLEAEVIDTLIERIDAVNAIVSSLIEEEENEWDKLLLRI